VLWQAAHRFNDPVNVSAGPVLAVACVGVAVKPGRVPAGCARAPGNPRECARPTSRCSPIWSARSGHHRRTAIAITGEDWIDPCSRFALGVWIVPRTLRLGAAALRVLLQAAPAHIDLSDLHADLAALPGVVGVHDLHVWTLTSQMEVATAHLQVQPGTDTHAVLDAAREVLAREHHLEHATLQVEPTDHTGCEEVGW